MERNTLASWAVGALVVALLVAFHWLAYRVGKARRLAMRKSSRDGGSGDGVSKDPLTPE
jgi:hypothetical protein